MRVVQLGTLCAIAILMVCQPAPGRGQAFNVGGAGVEGNDAETAGRTKLVPLPYVNYNRSIGWSFGALPLAMFNPVMQDTISPASLVGMVAMYTTNDSWMAMGFGKTFLAEDTWRIVAAGGKGSSNFQFYLDNPIGTWVPYNTAADIAYLDMQRRIAKDVFGGVSYLYMHARNTFELSERSSTTTLNGIGLSATLDARSSVFYPRSGYESSIRYLAYPEGLGNEQSSNAVDLDCNLFFPLRQDRDVMAARVFAGLGIGKVAFNQQYIVGRRSDIRGYTQGAHRGDYMLAVQGEYRWNFARRFGAVGFVGFATLFEAINESDVGRIFPGIGAGVRFTAFTDNHMNVGLDVAKGDGDWGTYFRIGEAF
jgi:outer membrane protein assembly factor BamA